MVKKYGYAGKILNIDLSQRTVADMATIDYAGRFVGGRGIAAKIYWDEVSPKAKPFEPERLHAVVAEYLSYL